ncbi:MAG: sugar ABC transporter ATP-binding protein [Vulcanimicrobiota bacterium]
MRAPLLTMEGISKFFPGVRALEGVGLQLYAGELHALMGENGAGKSTLMKVLGGVHRPDQGQMTLRGQPYAPNSPLEARQSGIGFVHQELKLATNLSVAENICLGRMPTRGFGVVDRVRMHQLAGQALQELGVELPTSARVGDLNVANQQMVELAKAIALKSDILIMDEPTASLSQKETRHLFEIIARLKAAGTAIVYISHRMEEVYELSERITVLRDGQSVGSWATAELDQNALVKAMVGRELKEQFPVRHPELGQEVLRVEGLTRTGVFSDVSFSLVAGEIVGMGGLVGAGRTEIARAIVGADPRHSGRVLLQGEPIDTATVREGIAHGLGYITEDRKGEGLVLGLSIEENVTLPNLGAIARGMLIDRARSRAMAEDCVERLKVRTPSVAQAVANLSGGNQQKVVIGKWLARNCRVLIFDEPTRGVDIGARAEIYSIIEELAEAGVGILVISSDLPELLGLSDRVLVVHQGRVAGEFGRDEATPEKVISVAFTGRVA